MRNKECFFSSFFFLMNAVVAYHYKYYSYSLSFIFLTITSLFHHYYFNNLTRQIDRVAIILMLYYTILIFYTKFNNKIINYIHILLYSLVCFFIFYIYIYGYFNNKYCYDTDHTTACLWHSLIHLSISICHIILVVL